MQEKTLFRIALIIVIMGLIFLFFYADQFSLKPSKSIEDIPVEENVDISGVITKLSKQEMVTFIEVEGQRVEKMDVIVFDKDLFLQEGDWVEVKGLIDEYNGKKEVIASKIVLK